MQHRCDTDNHLFHLRHQIKTRSPIDERFRNSFSLELVWYCMCTSKVCTVPRQFSFIPKLIYHVKPRTPPKRVTVRTMSCFIRLAGKST